MSKFKAVSWEYYDNYNNLHQVTQYFTDEYKDNAQVLYKDVATDPYLDSACIYDIELSEEQAQEIKASNWQLIHDQEYYRRISK